MSRNEYVAKLVREYADEWVRDPSIKMSKDTFKKHSAEKWAVEQAIDYIRYSDCSPADALANLSKRLISQPTSDWMFHVAKEVVDDLYYFVVEID